MALLLSALAHSRNVHTYVSVTLQECQQLGLERACHTSGMSIMTLVHVHSVYESVVLLCNRDERRCHQ